MACLCCCITNSSSDGNKDKLRFSRIPLIRLQQALPCQRFIANFVKNVQCDPIHSYSIPSKYPIKYFKSSLPLQEHSVQLVLGLSWQWSHLAEMLPKPTPLTIYRGREMHTSRAHLSTPVIFTTGVQGPDTKEHSGCPSQRDDTKAGEVKWYDRGTYHIFVAEPKIARLVAQSPR